MADPFKPSPSLLIKLGSVIVHMEELHSKNGNVEFDLPALQTARNDPEVVEWFAAMNKMAFLPVKR